MSYSRIVYHSYNSRVCQHYLSVSAEAHMSQHKQPVQQMDPDEPVDVLDAPPATVSDTSRPFNRTFAQPEPSPPIETSQSKAQQQQQQNQGPTPRELCRQKLQMLRSARTRGVGVRSSKSGAQAKETKKMANQYMQNPDDMLRGLGIEDDAVRTMLKQAMDRGDIHDVKKIATAISQSIEASTPPT